MSGLGNTGGGKTYVNQFKGNFTVRSNADDPEAKQRINKMGKTVYEKLYNTLSGYITGIKKTESEDYGFGWEVTVEADGKDYTLNMSYIGRTTMGIFLRLPNIDLNKEVELKLFYFEEEDKSALVVYQDGEKIMPFWTKDDPKTLPQMEKTMVNGKETWDSTQRMKYLEKYLETKVEPRLKDAIGNRVVTPPKEEAGIDQRHPGEAIYDGVDSPPPPEEPQEELEDDDLPF